MVIHTLLFVYVCIGLKRGFERVDSLAPSFLDEAKMIVTGMPVVLLLLIAIVFAVAPLLAFLLLYGALRKN